MPSLVTLLPFVFELSSKNHRGGGGKMTPPPTRAKVNVNPRTAGGGHICAPPHRFFADSRKMAARSAAKFGIAVQSSFAHLVLKF